MISRDAAKERGDVVAWLEGFDHPPKFKEAARFLAKLIQRGEHAGYNDDDFYPEDYDLDT